jgi:hypothetical protein
MTVGVYDRIRDGLARRIGRLRDAWSVGQAFTRVHGPARVALGDDEAGLVVLAKDAEWFMADCLRHHLDMGLAHVVVVDNGSSDRTVEIASAFDRVTVLSNRQPAKRYEVLLRSMAAQRVLQGGWVAFADTDEMLEWPGSLGALLRYCNRTGCTAVLGQMLDLAMPGDQRAQRGLDYAGARAVCREYTLEGLVRYPYGGELPQGLWHFLEPNRCTDPGIEMLSGGLRFLNFGERPMLSKHSLVRQLPGVRTMTHPHCATGVTMADVSVAIRHYKLAGDWRARDRSTARANAWDHAEDRTRLAASARDDFVLAVPSAQVWRGWSALREQGFVYASPTARRELGQGAAAAGDAVAAARSAEMPVAARLDRD